MYIGGHSSLVVVAGAASAFCFMTVYIQLSAQEEKCSDYSMVTLFQTGQERIVTVQIIFSS